jgi:hypothetical protein
MFDIPYKNVQKVKDVDIIKQKNMSYPIPLTNKKITKEKKKEENITKEKYRTEIFGNDSEKTTIIAGRNYFGDGIFPILTDDTNTIVIQCGYFHSDVVISMMRVIEKKEDTIQMLVR